MFGISRRIKQAAAAGSAMAMALTLALLGFVWLSIAAYTALATWMAPAGAMVVVGLTALLPLLVLMFRPRPEKREEPEPSETDHDISAVARLAHSASLIAERSPLAGVALTLGAAFIAARSSTTAPLAVHMLAEAVERWAAKPPASPAATEPEPPAAPPPTA
jgi:hypothetical protein